MPSLPLSLTIIILLGFGTINAWHRRVVASRGRLRALVRSSGTHCAARTMWRPPSAAADALPACCGRHVLPNSLTSVVALAALPFGSAIPSISALGFHQATAHHANGDLR